MPVPAGAGATSTPTGPLVYDPLLSRVRISATVLSVSDTFGRTVSNEWGPSDSGHVWINSGGLPSEHSVSSGVGRHSLGSVNVLRTSLVDVGSPDVEYSVDVSLSHAGGATSPITVWPVARVTDLSNYYVARLSASTAAVMSIELAKRVNGTLITVAPPVVVGPNADNDWWRVTIRTAGTSIVATARNLTTGSTPVTVTGTDTILTTGTQAGVLARLEAGNTNTLPVTILYDNFTVVPTVAVERSTDQVRWTTVRGGGALVPVNGAISLDDYEFAADVVNYYRLPGWFGSITPTLDGVWIKSIARPFLNRQVTVVDFSDVERPSRTGVFDVIGRSVPVAVNDVRGSRRWTLDVLTQTLAEAEDFDLVLASGDPLFVHVPAGVDVPGGYVTVGDTSERRTARRSVRRVFSLPCTEVAAPGPDVVGATVNWQTVLSTYATWADLLAAHPTWASLLELIGGPEDVIVP